MKKGILISCLMVGLVIFVSTQVMAQEGRIRMGKLRIIPGLTVKGLYDDNIYLGSGTNNTDELEESDWITQLMPSLLFDYGFDGRGSLRVGYQGTLAYYDDRNENDWQTHTGTFALNYEAPGGFLLDINNTYTDAEDPYGNAVEFGLGEPLTDRWSNDLKTNIGYNFGNRLKLILFYNYFKQDYEQEEDSAQDKDSNEFGAGLQMRLFPKTWGFIRYHYGEEDYFTHPIGSGRSEANDADYEWHRVNLGLTWDPGAKLSGELNFGYEWKDPENSRDPAGDLYEDSNTWIASTSVSYIATATTSLSLSVTRSVSATGASTKELLENTSLGLNLNQRMLAKFTLTAGVGYSKGDYNQPANNPREDNNYDANANLNYQIQEWLNAGFGYAWKRKNSIDIANEYKDNQVMVTLSATY